MVREGVIAASLTSLMILVFLGSWRRTLIICVSIPLSIMTRAVAEVLLPKHQHHDSGGLALACGRAGGRCDGRNREHERKPGLG